MIHSVVPASCSYYAHTIATSIDIGLLAWAALNFAKRKNFTKSTKFLLIAKVPPL